MNNFEKTIVTAALPYANGQIHLGHLAGAYLPADIYVRFKRLKGEDIIFICGSDEHGVPITITADKEKITPQEVVDRYHELNYQAFLDFGMSFDNYSRTSLPLHHQTAQEFFLKFHKAGILKEKLEKQYFDQKAQMFLPDRYLIGTCPYCKSEDARGDQCESCGSYLNPTDLIEPRSKITGETPILKETSHWYFPLGEFQTRLEAYIKEKNELIGWKENVLNYCNSWFKEGLADRAVTRDLDWGVKLPIEGYENKVLYVWFDAVLGYISSTKEWSQKINQPNKWKDYWLNNKTKYYAFIGKDNVVFHCIVFPAMLMAWNDNSEEKYILPDNVPANEFLNFEGQKFSKSRGWGIDVKEFLENFPADYLRYYLATILPENRDSDFYWKEFQARNNNELADIFGNFVNRTLTFTEKHFNSGVPKYSQLTSSDLEMLTALKSYKTNIESLYERVKIKDALSETMNLARLANKYFNDSEPWKTIKSDVEKCSATIYVSLQVIRTLTIFLSPIIPFTAEKIFGLLNISDKPELKNWDLSAETKLEFGHKISKSEILFKKIEDSQIQPFLNALGKNDSSIEQNQQDERISIDEFKKVKIRVAKVIECQKIEKSEKLLKIKVDLGNEVRQVIAGLAKFYQPEEIIGKKVLVVTNLVKARLMNQESDGMILAVEDGNNLKLIEVGDDLPLGSLLR
ncbi:MAG: methionine--tRNA ligase [Ignavibacteria bacterium]|nr:methionine--tRNA ligase [Ignavibacteria bacterium]